MSGVGLALHEKRTKGGWGGERRGEGDWVIEQGYGGYGNA